MSITKQRKEKIKNQIRQRVNDKILEANNGNLLIKLVDMVNEEEADALLQMATNNQITGLHFDSRFEIIDTENINYLEKDVKHSFVQDENKPINKLILGDNYKALRNLLISHKGAIDVIYIDPPYASDSMGEHAKTNYTNGLTRDNLLSMLQPRLELALDLLSDDGVIFVSIDDKNQAYVKCLMDEVFGENNNICQFIRQTRFGGGYGTSDVGIEHEYLLCYAKYRENIEFQKINKTEEEIKKYFNKTDKYGKYHKRELRQSDTQEGKREDRPSMFFPILVKDNLFFLLDINEYNSLYDSDNQTFNDSFLHIIKQKYEKQGFKFILPIMKSGEFGRWSFGYDGIKKIIEKNNILFEDNKLYQKERVTNEKLMKVITSIISSPDYTNAAGTSELKTVFFNREVFKNPKPIELIKTCIKFSTLKKNAIVLDFFAGSGTTGQAVMELNKEDGGNRTFILNTLKDDNGDIGLGVCAERLKRIMTGSGYNNETGFEWLKKNQPYKENLEVLNVASISNTDESIFEKIDETVYGLDKMEIKDKINWVCDNFDNVQKECRVKNEVNENE